MCFEQLMRGLSMRLRGHFSTVIELIDTVKSNLVPRAILKFNNLLFRLSLTAKICAEDEVELPQFGFF